MPVKEDSEEKVENVEKELSTEESRAWLFERRLRGRLLVRFRLCLWPMFCLTRFEELSGVVRDCRD